MDVVWPRRPSLARYISRLTPAAALAPRLLLFVDQAVFSLANFILTTVLARRYPAAQFGAYGVALSAALLIQSIQRNMYVVSLSLMSERVTLRWLPGILAKHFMVTGGAVGIAAVTAAAFALAGLDGGSIDILVATLGCMAVYFQADFDRALLVKRRAFLGAVMMSVLYLTIVASVAVLGFVLSLSFRGFMLVFGGICLGKSVWLIALRTAPRWRWGVRFLKRDWHNYGLPTLLSAASGAGYTYVPVMVLAATRGAAEVAGLSAMRSLTMPLNLALRSLDAVDKSRLQALSGGTTRGMRRVFWRTMLGYAALGALAFCLLAVFAEPIISIVYGGRYSTHTGLLLCWCAYCALLGLMQPLQSVTFLMGRQMAATRWSMLSGVVAVIIAFATCGRLGAPGAMTATLTAATLSVVIGAYVMREVLFGADEVSLPRSVDQRRLRRRTS